MRLAAALPLRRPSKWSREPAAIVPRLQSLWGSGDYEVSWYFHMMQEQEHHRPTLYSILRKCVVERTFMWRIVKCFILFLGISLLGFDQTFSQNEIDIHNAKPGLVSKPMTNLNVGTAEPQYGINV